VQEYPGLEVHGVVGDFATQLAALPPARHRRLVVFLGGTIGNFRPPAARDFLRRLGSRMQPGEHLLLGTDLVKDRAALEAAYDDAAGVTAEFNRNALRVLNRKLGGDFDPNAFAHRAVFDAEEQWIEMWLVAQRAQSVRLPALELELRFEPGDAIRTEISAKYDRARVEALLAASGFELSAWETDPSQLFALTLARRA
jgi:L-histidine N-alpha-methyltransferase